MILYFAVTNYHILCAILHKLKYKPEKEAILLIPKAHTDFSILQKKLLETKIFKNVYGFDEPHIKKTNQITDSLITQTINDIVTFIEKNFPVNTKDFTEINTFADHYAYGVFLVVNGYKYNYFEEAMGRLSTSESVYEHIKSFSPVQAEIIKKLQLFGNNDLVTNRYGDLTKQKEGYKNEKDVHFSVTKILESLSQKQIQKIKNVFISQDLSTKKQENSALLLTQHYINLGLLTFDEQKLLYFYLTDYFAENKKVYIKIHPSDVQGLYSQWFPEAEILDRQYPSELLPYLLNKNFDIGIAASSTGIFNLSKILNDIVCFTQQIEKTFKSMNKYFTTLKLIELIPSENKKEIFTYGIDIKQLEELARHYKIKLPKITNLEEEKFPIKKKSRLFIIDDFYFITNPRKSFTSIRKNLNEDDLIIYLNSEDKNLCFYPNDKTFDKTVIPIVIEKENIKDEYNTEFIDKETMFTITHNKEITEIAKNLKFEKDLKYTGIKIIVDQNNNYKRKYLESKLAVIDTNIIEIAKNYLILKDDNSRQEKRIDKTLNSKSWQITKIFRNLSKKVQKHYEKK
jgi:hypothetical protein